MNNKYNNLQPLCDGQKFTIVQNQRICPKSAPSERRRSVRWTRSERVWLAILIAATLFVLPGPAFWFWVFH